MAWELCTFDQLKAILGLTKSALTDYPDLAIIKLKVEAAIENYIGRGLEKKERTELFYVTGPTYMFSLKGLPVDSVSSLTVTTSADAEDYSSDDYDFAEYGLKLPFDMKDAKVEITYTGGVSEDTVPDDINRAALYQTSFEYLGKDQMGAEAVSTEGGTVSRPELGLLKEVKRDLTRYIHPLKITG